MKNRAYAVMDIKEATEVDGKRVFTGIASTPSTDRMDDIVEPLGAQFKLPMPLLWQHDSRQPIGWVTAAKVTADSIEVTCELAVVPEESNLKQRLLDAWLSIKHKLVRGLSIGFNSIEHSQIDGTWGYRFTKWEWLELSAVTIPANQDASITAIKSLSRMKLAALGRELPMVERLDATPPPGVSGKPKQLQPNSRTGKGNDMKTIAERIKEAEASRAALMARAQELIDKGTDGGDAMDEADEQEYTQCLSDVKKVDTNLARLREHDKLAKASATEVSTVVTTTNDDGSSSVRLPAGSNVLSVRRNLPKGTAFTRYAMALAHSKGNMGVAQQVAKQFKDTPEVGMAIDAAAMGGTDFAKRLDVMRMMQKAASDAGTSLDATWAGPLVYYENMQSEFIELLRPKTILGRMTGLRNVPFNIRVASQSSGSTVGWVGEAAPKPVGELGFGSVQLGHAKAAGIIVITMELARFSSPSAEALVRNDLVAEMVKFLDQQFIDPAVAAVANVSPASVTNGATSVPSTGVTIAAITTDVKALFALYYAAELDPANAVWVMRPGTALNLSMVRTNQDAFAFPDITPQGGTFFGLPVITSNSVPGTVSGGSIMALVLPNEIWMADDGNVNVDVSQEASLQMNTTPSAGAQSLVSLWQNNLIGIRAEREINWQKRRAQAVAYIDGVGF